MTRALLAALIAAVAAEAVGQSPRPAVDMTVIVRPLKSGTAEVTSIEVRIELKGALPNRPLRLQSPITYASVRNIADRIDSLVVRDSAGVAGLTIENDAVNAGGFPYYRHWRTDRPLVGRVVVTYRMRPFAGVPVTGPQFDLYAHGGGFSTGGMALFVVPEGLGTIMSHVRWDLSQLASGSVAASTYGEGNLDLAGPVDRIIQSYYMAGPMGRYSPDNASGFRAYWLGETQFDAAKEMAWSYQSYRNLRSFHADTGSATYNVFVRAIPGAAATLGGTALQNSFMVGVVAGPRDTAKTAPRNTIAHEMGHMWVGSLTGGGNTTWFTEGLNVYYTRLLLLRAGLISVDEYGRDVNNSANAYYSNPYRNASADSLGRLGFSAGVGSGSAQNVAYNRGSLFFADVDARIRAASNGTRKLDDVILPLLAQRRRGTPITTTMLLDALVKELGAGVREVFDAVLVRGEILEPASGAFGPCFERRSMTYSVRGRDGAGLEFTSAPAAGFEWVRVSSVEEARCRAW